MATPIAHKGIVYGAKVEALTLVDLLTKPDVLTKAWDYYKNEQTREQKYTPLIGDTDKPAINLNKKIMEEFAPKLKPFYYNPVKYKTYLEQLGIPYPTLRQDQKEAVEKLGTKKQ
jgi:aminobenzoyl-glutamate utilization protein B